MKRLGLLALLLMFALTGCDVDVSEPADVDVVNPPDVKVVDPPDVNIIDKDGK
jgi:hypothetical protein